MHPNGPLQTEPWGTKEFGAIDPNGGVRYVSGVKWRSLILIFRLREPTESLHSPFVTRFWIEVEFLQTIKCLNVKLLRARDNADK